jgi:hypothetical protein
VLCLVGNKIDLDKERQVLCLVGNTLCLVGNTSGAVSSREHTVSGREHVRCCV